MGLIGNYSVIFKSPGRHYGGVYANDRGAYLNGQSNMIQRFTHYSKTSAMPNGYYPPYCYALPMTAGEISSRYTINGIGAIGSANLAGGKYGDLTMSGSGQISNATMELLASVIATLNGVGTINSAAIAGALTASSVLAGSATLDAFIDGFVSTLDATMSGAGNLSGTNLTPGRNISASVSGAGQITNADMQIVAVIAASILASGSLSANGSSAVNIASILSGSGAIPSASITALAGSLAAILAGGSINNSAIDAIANMEAEITPFTDASPENIARLVWSRLSIDSNDPESMGEVLNEVLIETKKRLKKNDYLALK